MATNKITKKQALAEWKFWRPTVMRSNGTPDYHCRRVVWDAFVDGLCKDGRISQSQYDRWAYPADCFPRKR